MNPELGRMIAIFVLLELRDLARQRGNSGTRGPGPDGVNFLSPHGPDREPKPLP
jgi:hypothetical protein